MPEWEGHESLGHQNWTVGMAGEKHQNLIVGVTGERHQNSVVGVAVVGGPFQKSDVAAVEVWCFLNFQN